MIIVVLPPQRVGLNLPSRLQWTQRTSRYHLIHMHGKGNSLRTHAQCKWREGKRMVGRPTRMLRFRSLTFPPSLLMPATAARAPFSLPNEVKSGPTGSDPEVDGANFGRLLHLSPKENTYNCRSRTCASLDFNKMAFKCEQRSGTRISAKYQWSGSSIRSFLQILGLMARPTTWQPIQGLLLARDPSL